MGAIVPTSASLACQFRTRDDAQARLCFDFATPARTIPPYPRGGCPTKGYRRFCNRSFCLANRIGVVNCQGAVWGEQCPPAKLNAIRCAGNPLGRMRKPEEIKMDWEVGREATSGLDLPCALNLVQGIVPLKDKRMKSGKL